MKRTALALAASAAFAGFALPAHAQGHGPPPWEMK